MKRITQILASILFVITVLTVYLVFDFAISNAVSYKNSPQKRSHHEHEHEHNHNHDDIKITRKRSITPSISHQIKKSNQTIKHHNQDENHNNERRTRNVKPASQQQPRSKPGNFHKGKTGVKVNKPQKSLKEQKRRLSTSTIQSQHKDKHHFNDNGHV